MLRSRVPSSRPHRGRVFVFALSSALVVSLSCGDGPRKDKGDAGTDEPVRMSREQLMNPQTCASCHPRHYKEWSSSMHAYATKDPVFLAMNRRGQRETNGALGDFCINCHAPMAVRDGLTTDGLNIEELPEEYQGITCYFCHNTVGVEAPHNGALVVANDQTMRGSLRNPVDPGVHAVAYSSLHDRDNLKSSELCGACHDVVTPAGVHMERTYAEYLESHFSKEGTPGFDTCNGCHMPVSRSDAPVAVMPGVDLPKRPMHEHLWPGVDIALTDDFPHQEAYRKAVECAVADGTTTFEMVATDYPISTRFSISWETQAGHAQPSGASQDRRMWLEFIAYDADDNVIYQTGVIPDQAIEELPKDDPNYDPNHLVFRDRIFDAMGKEVHMFWDAAPSDAYPKGYADFVLPLAVSAIGRHTRTAEVILPRGIGQPARISARLMIRPIGMDILHDLVATGDLDPSVLARVPTFPVHGTHVEWTIADGPLPVRTVLHPPIDCPNDYLKLLE